MNMLLATVTAIGLMAVALAHASDTESAPPKEHAMESAKRRAPAVVKPVVVEGVRYEAPLRARIDGPAQHGGVVFALDDKTGAMVWTVQLYKTAHDGMEETDVQDVYVTQLALDASGHALLATDERRRVWSVDLATRAVVRIDPH